jgi:hypothetical protein
MSKEPRIAISYAKGKKVVATRKNTTLYRFQGANSMYDHIFVLISAKEGRGLYIFRHEDGYTKLANFMMDNDYPAYINLREVSEGDKRMFDEILQEATSDVEGGIPSDWS